MLQHYPPPGMRKFIGALEAKIMQYMRMFHDTNCKNKMNNMYTKQITSYNKVWKNNDLQVTKLEFSRAPAPRKTHTNKKSQFIAGVAWMYLKLTQRVDQGAMEGISAPNLSNPAICEKWRKSVLGPNGGRTKADANNRIWRYMFLLSQNTVCDARRSKVWPVSAKMTPFRNILTGIIML